ncbi:MAG: peptidylprolyl isomerase [Firmicutes bacterium ADurb.Bin248]|nr:MAG: peptidylprolyl isomerase [Firmicutes bacterium ADurb.Bin248]HOG00571.1 SurA N-terminal domain-containing protein [Clostridia bacterium]HPK14766.1 SurA N-terminal domain-containing protein [Clostridia bacterium]
MKKWISVLLAAFMLLPLIAACKLTDDEPDLKAVVATVGGEEITLGEVKALFDSYVTYFSYYGYDVTGDTETLHQFQDDIVNKMVEDKLIVVKAKELGYDQFTEEQQAELDARVAEELEAMQEYYRSQAESEYESDNTVNVEERTQELILEEANNNMNRDDATYEEYTEFIREDMTATYLGELLRAGQLKDLSVSEEDVQNEYQTQVDADTASYTESPAAYLAAQESYESLGEGAPALYVPEGYHRVYDIFIKFEGTLPDEYNTNKTQMDKLTTEYQNLAFSEALSGINENSTRMQEILAEYAAAQTAGDKAKMDALKAEYQELAFAEATAGEASENAKRMGEIMSEYAALQAKNDELFAAYAAGAKAKIDEIYAKLEAGENFKELMLANTQNENFNDGESLFVERGMLITNDYDTDDSWGDITKETFASLAAGKYSEPYSDSDGYHILFNIGSETPGVRALDDTLRAYFEGVAKATLEETEWQALIDAWKAEAEVTINTEVYRVLGTTATGEE